MLYLLRDGHFHPISQVSKRRLRERKRPQFRVCRISSTLLSRLLLTLPPPAPCPRRLDCRAVPTSLLALGPRPFQVIDWAQSIWVVGWFEYSCHFHMGLASGRYWRELRWEEESPGSYSCSSPLAPQDGCCPSQRSQLLLESPLSTVPQESSSTDSWHFRPKKSHALSSMSTFQL